MSLLVFFTNSFLGPTPMDLDPLPKPSLNSNYNVIGKAFIESFGNASNNNFFSTASYYENSSLITLKIGPNLSADFIGPIQFFQRLHDLGIFSIVMHNIDFTTQPLGKSSIVIQTHGDLLINGFHKIKFSMTTVLKRTFNCYVIGQKIFSMHQ